jgi:hypothetical protein
MSDNITHTISIVLSIITVVASLVIFACAFDIWRTLNRTRPRNKGGRGARS